jgi:hypothetical protein
MSDRELRILVIALAGAAVVLLGYAAWTVASIVQGMLEPGPLRLLTLAFDALAGGLAAWGAASIARRPPRA